MAEQTAGEYTVMSHLKAQAPVTETRELVLTKKRQT